MTRFVMDFPRRVIALAALIQCTGALVEFSKSKLFDEFDFAKESVSILNFCEVGCRIYVSVPTASVQIAKQIVVNDYTHKATSLHDISTMKIGAQKGFYQVEVRNDRLDVLNSNPNYATAPLALWIVREDADHISGYNEGIVYEAANLRTAPASIGMVTVISAEPFTIRTKTEGNMKMIATLSGFDAITADSCVNVVEQTTAQSYADIQVAVQSPLLTLYYDDNDNRATMIALSADVGKTTTLDFSGVSFAASPGFIGCAGGKTFRSSLYGASTFFKYYKNDRMYDVVIGSVLNTDAQHPVIIRDYTNPHEYNWHDTAGGDRNSVTLQRTNNVEISWTRNENDLDQYFLVRLTPYNEQIIVLTTPAPTEPSKPDTTRRTTTETTTMTSSHPKDVTTSTTSTQITWSTEAPTTSGAESYGSSMIFTTIIARCIL